MEVVLEKYNVNTNFQGRELDYQIDMTGPYFFNMLRKQIYFDPKAAICREICDNARDAHREVGAVNRPIEITLPGSYLVIRDFGPGMSPERIDTVYRIYGKSTKRSNNEQGGGFGLGAKTPFAYTDQFWVETIYNGIKYVWLNFIDETGCGKLKLCSEEKTIEERGTAIKIPIKSLDKSIFTNHIINYTKYWNYAGDAQPIYHGLLIDPFKKPILQGTNWLVFDDIHCAALVNGMPYSINQQLPKGTVINFKVGELDLAAHRDTIYYSDRTNIAIKDAINKMNNEIIQIVNDKADTLEFYDLLEMIYRFNLPAKVWKWRDKQFKCPIDQKLGVRRSHSFTYYHTTTRLAKNTRLILVDSPLDTYTKVIMKDNLTSYQKSKISNYIHTNNIDGLVVRPDDELVGIIPHIKLEDIKIVRNKSGSSNYVSVKGKVKAYCIGIGIHLTDRDNRGKIQVYCSIDCKITGRSYYPQNDIREFSETIYPVYCIFKDDIKKLSGNWVSFENYKKDVLKDIPQNIQDEIGEARWMCIKYSKYQFMEDYKDFDFFNWKNKYNNYVKKFPKFVETLKKEPKDSGFLYKKYPILSLINSFLSNKNDQLVIRDYVKEKENV